MNKLAIILLSVLIASCSDGNDSGSAKKQGTARPIAANGRTSQVNNSTSRDTSTTQNNDNPFISSSNQPVEGDSDIEKLEVQDENEIGEDLSKEITAVTFREASESYIEWNTPTDISYVKADVIITSSANGKSMRRSFVQGEAIVVNDQLPDGHYLWESVITPEIDAYTKQEMRSVRESGNMAEEQALMERLRTEGSLPTEAQIQENRQTGSFSVQNGIATPVSPTYADDDQRQDEKG
jgi:hypothetical protein